LKRDGGGLLLLLIKEATMDILDVFVDMQATGEKIKQLRKQNHYKVFELATALGLESDQAIYKWQRGQCLPNADNLVRLSILFGCHIDDILVHNMIPEEGVSPLLPLCA
jgi:transcriptional regulator with XRE-family HTH domain